jgi:hypothetical protein
LALQKRDEKITQLREIQRENQQEKSKLNFEGVRLRLIISALLKRLGVKISGLPTRGEDCA